MNSLSLKFLKKLLSITLTVLLIGSLAACSASLPAVSNNAEKSMQDTNKATALAFYRTGITTQERDAMIHVGYIQHNPAAVKFAQKLGITAKQAFPLWMAKILTPASASAQSTGSQAPAGQQAYMAIAEGDKVFLMHQRFSQDPNEAPGTFYEHYSWGMFGFKDGLIHEHWDGNLIKPE